MLKLRGLSSVELRKSTLLSNGLARDVAGLFYGYATGVFSSRKLERATYDSVAFHYIAANDHPDHDTIANFRKRFLLELTSLFVQILQMLTE